MKQTAIEWLQKEIDNKDMGEIPMWIYEIIEQAKAMEKEQIIDAYEEGYNRVVKVIEDVTQLNINKQD